MTAETTTTAEATAAPVATTSSNIVTPADGKPTTGAEGSLLTTPPAKTDGATPTPATQPAQAGDYKLSGEFDAQVLSTVADFAKQNSISQEAAQKLVNTVAPVMAKRAQEVRLAQQEKWRSEVTNHPTVGKDKLTQSMSVAGQVLDKFGTPALRAWLDESGAGDNPALFEFVVQVGRAFAPDTFTAGRSASSDLSTAKVLYPSMK